MDLWVVAAAAGAGYLAKYWNKISKDGDSSYRLSSEDSNFENPESSSCPFSLLKQARKGELGKDVSLDRRASKGKSSDVDLPDDLVTGEVASNIRHFQNYSNSDVLSISNLVVPLSQSDGNFKNFEDGIEQSSNIGGNHGFFVPDSSAKVVPVHNSSGHKTFLRTRNLSGHISKPLNSLESCFMAQLYKEHAKIEEYVFSPLSSSSTTTRSLLVSNGSQIINHANDISLSASFGIKEYKLHKDASQVRDENVFGIPSLPKLRTSNEAKKMKLNAFTGRSRRLSSSGDLFSGKLIHTHCDPTFLFSLGISFGMIASIVENKKEMDSLRELLKQTENLVQDLQEELEMKDSLTVKEINNENYGSQDTCDHSSYDKELNEFSPEKHMDNSPRINCKESYDKAELSSESISKIEAELEAELERLGLDMNASSLEGKLSELVELEPEFVADFAKGELRAETVGGKNFVHPKSNEVANDTTPLPGNYAVLPHELSLRLHEVIQSQLEQRVKELESALENSQRKIRLMESEREGNSQKGDSLTSGNLFTYEDCDTMSQPLVLNLSGEALDAYNEAYEELIRINDSEENSPSGTHDSDHKEGLHSLDWNALEVQHDGENCSTPYSTINGRRLSGELSSSQVTMFEGQSSRIYELNDIGDESCDGDNEVERQLIRQIVERSKKGSSVFQNAQKMLYSMDDDEH